MAKSRKTSAANEVGLLRGPATNAPLRTQAAAGNNIRNWRLFRGIPKHGALAALTAQYDPKGKGINRVSLLRLENGEGRYNEDHLRLLSLALRVAPRDLIGTNPFDAGDIFAIYAGFSDEQKLRAAQMLAKLKP